MARLLRVIRVFHGLDLQEAEEKLEISRYTIEKYENDLKQIPLHVAATYGWKFGYSLDVLHFFRNVEDTWLDKIRLRVGETILKFAEYVEKIDVNTD